MRADTIRPIILRADGPRRVARASLAGLVALSALAASSPARAEAPAQDSPRSVASRPASQAALDVGSPVPYRFNEATIIVPRGLSGTASLRGTSLDGTVTTLFEAELGYAETLVATYYAWPELTSLTFQGHSGDGEPVTALARLGGRGFGARTGDDAEATRLSGLAFPYRRQPAGMSPGMVDASALSEANPERAARFALERLFVSRRSATAIAILSAWAATVMALTACLARLTRGARPAWAAGPAPLPGAEGSNEAASCAAAPDPTAKRVNAAAAARVAAVIIACAAAGAIAGLSASVAVASSAPPAELFIAALTAQGEPSSVYRAREDSGGYATVSWLPLYPEQAGRDASARQSGKIPSGGLVFIGARSPAEATIPVAAFSSFKRIRFKRAPLVVPGPDGRPTLAPAPFNQAWGLHE
jgi:hypothetical protein